MKSAFNISLILIMLGLTNASPVWSRDLFRTIGGVTTKDFGQVSDTVPVIYHVFELQNISDKPAKLDRCVTSCSSIEVLYDQDSIPPGKVTKVTVALDLSHTKDDFEIPVNLFDNQKNLYYFAMKGVIVHCDSLSTESMVKDTDN